MLTDSSRLVRERLGLWARVNEVLLESGVSALATRGEIEAVYRRTTCARQAARFIIEERENEKALTQNTYPQINSSEIKV